MTLPTPVETSQLPLPDREAYDGEPREYARALMSRKDEIEHQIESLRNILANNNATAETSLFDPEGYPRADIDIYIIRHARAALTRLYNDRDEVIRRLAIALEDAFTVDLATEPVRSIEEPRRAEQATVNGQQSTSTLLGEIPDIWPERPVARVNSVAEGSPAAEAGLQPGDRIHSFSGITNDRAEALRAIGALVAASEGVTLTLLVLRNAERIMLRLTPKSGWGGRGLLGCHILPV